MQQRKQQQQNRIAELRTTSCRRAARLDNIPPRGIGRTHAQITLRDVTCVAEPVKDISKGPARSFAVINAKGFSTWEFPNLRIGCTVTGQPDSWKNHCSKTAE